MQLRHIFKRGPLSREQEVRTQTKSYSSKIESFPFPIGLRVYFSGFRPIPQITEAAMEMLVEKYCRSAVKR